MYSPNDVAAGLGPAVKHCMQSQYMRSSCTTVGGRTGQPSIAEKVGETHGR